MNNKRKMKKKKETPLQRLTLPHYEKVIPGGWTRRAFMNLRVLLICAGS
jgi:hypothetical protein